MAMHQPRPPQVTSCCLIQCPGRESLFIQPSLGIKEQAVQLGTCPVGHGTVGEAARRERTTDQHHLLGRVWQARQRQLTFVYLPRAGHHPGSLLVLF